MTVQRFYQLSLAIPLVVPAIVISGGLLFGAPAISSLYLNTILNVVAMSGILGGLPYAVLAIWWWRWIPGHSEAEIRRMLLRAPLVMQVAFVPMAIFVAVAGGDRMQGIGIYGISVVAIFVLGYGYVALVFLLRQMAGARRWLTSPDRPLTNSSNGSARTA